MELTPLEKGRIFAMYPDCAIYTPNMPDKLAGVDFTTGNILLEILNANYTNAKMILKALEDMPDGDIYWLCYTYDNIPFIGTNPREWRIKRQSDIIRVEHKNILHNYAVDISNGNVTLFRDAKTSGLGCQGYVTQWLLQHYYAIPLHFGPGHHLNGKTAFDIGLAVPDKTKLTQLLNQHLDNDADLVIDWYNDKQLLGIDLNDIKIYREYVNEMQNLIKVK